MNPLKIRNLVIEPPVILAPMAGISGLPYRKIHKKFGCPLAFTEMVSARGLFSQADKSREFLKKDGEPPLTGVQIFGSDHIYLAKAAGYCATLGFDVIDINMGCPVKKVVRDGGGAELLRYPEKVKNIIRNVRKSVTERPLTVKIRSGWSEEEKNFLEIGRIAEGEGADAVTIHPRTRVQQFEGKAKWDDIAQLKKNIKIPVIGNGDVRSASDVKKMFSETGCDAVMIGRAALGNPWFFREILTGDNTIPALEGKKEIMLEHTRENIRHYGKVKGAIISKKHLCWYLKGYKGVSIMRKEIMSARDFRELEILISRL